jgi:hypothetical protein
MNIRFTKAPTFTKAIIASAVFAIAYLTSTSNLPSCNDTVAVLNSGECIERQSFLHTASGWLALLGLLVAVVLLALKHKDTILGRQAPATQAPAPQAPQGAPAAAWEQVPVPAQGPERASSFCAKCGTRIIAGDRFCQGCGVPMESH